MGRVVGLLLVAACIFGGISVSPTMGQGEPLIVVPENPSIAFRDSLAARLASEAYFGPLQTADLRLFLRIYLIDEPAFRGVVRASDATAYPVFYGSVPVGIMATMATEMDGDAVYRQALSEMLALATTEQLKKLAERIRPVHYSQRLVVEGRVGRRRDAPESHSFPSGHAAVAAAIVTSWSLSHPRWYVIVPGAAWAAGVGVSRVWLGRHFPGDVAAGWLLGIAAAVLVDRLDRYVTPSVLKEEDEGGGAMFRLRVPLG